MGFSERSNRPVLSAALAALTAIGLTLGTSGSAVAQSKPKKPRKPRTTAPAPAPQKEEEQPQGRESRVVSDLMQDEPALDLLNARLLFLPAVNSGGNTYTGELAWVPAYSVSPRLTARFKFGLSIFDGLDSDFLVLSYNALGGYQFSSRWEAEALLGAQTWTEDGGTFLQVGGNANYLFPEPVLEVVDRIVLGYSAVTTEDLTHEFRAGVGANF